MWGTPICFDKETCHTFDNAARKRLKKKYGRKRPREGELAPPPLPRELLFLVLFCLFVCLFDFFFKDYKKSRESCRR